MEDIAITKAENTIEMMMDKMIKALEVLTFQLSKANESRHGGYQTGRAYTIQANDPPPHGLMNFPLLNPSMAPASY